MSLFSWDYHPEHSADDWFRMAHAYADAAVALFEQLSAGKLPPTYHHAKVAAEAFEHGLELFLKAALLLAGDRVARSHRLEGLVGRYRTLYPGKPYAFTGSVDEAARDLETRPSGQFLRYPEDPKGTPWPGNVHFDLAIWTEQVKLFRDDYRRLEPRLRARSRPVTS